MNRKIALMLGYVSLSMATTTTAQAQLLINEVMQSNIDCIVDDINEFPDSWVELYNSGTETESLSTYKIGLTDDVHAAYSLPARSVSPQSYVLIYCDKAKDGLHTDFRLETGKNGCLYLFKNGTLVDKIEKMKKQPAPNIAYGRKTNGSDSWGYMATPTPNAANCGKTYKEILGEPVFDIPGQIFESNRTISVSLSLPEGTPEGTIIRYTTDGAEPTETSTLYQGAITINKPKVIRAKLFCDGYLSPRSTTASYIFHNRKMTLPVISIAGSDKYFYDNNFGILVDGTYNSSQKNYNYDWRRPINLEFFTAAGSKSELNQLCEARVMGGATRSNPLKSLAIYANKRFGEKRFNYEFFPDQRPGITDFKSLALRNAGNDFDYLYMRDAIIQRSMAQYADLDWQAWRPAIVYINGVYKGMLNIRERSNEDNIYTNHEGLEDIDMFENNWELKSGDWTNFNNFKNFYNEHGHTMAEYDKIMDCQEYINLMVMNLFYNNLDFPGNNIVIWRPRAEGGRWRWIAKDTDYSLNLYNDPYTYKIFEYINNHDYDPSHNWANDWDATRLFRRLMEDADFKRELLDHAAIYLGDFMTEKNIRKLWDGMYDIIKDEYPLHRKLFNQWWPNYSDELNNARNWLHNRIPEFYKQMADYYQLGNPTPMTITQDGSLQEQTIPLTFNGVKLRTDAFDGKFFEGRKMTIEAGEENGKTIESWDVTTYGSNGRTTQHYEGTSFSINMPKCSKLEVIANIGNATGINIAKNDIEGLRTGTPVLVYSMQGCLIYHSTIDESNIRLWTNDSFDIPLTQGTYILKIGNKVKKITKK